MSFNAENDVENASRVIETVRDANWPENIFESPDMARHRKLIDIHLQFQPFLAY